MTRVEVAWSPSKFDRFALIGPESLNLYKVFSSFRGASNFLSSNLVQQPLTEEPFPLSSFSSACLLSSTSDSLNQVQSGLVKCFSWNPRSELDHLVAIGHSNGHVSIVSPLENINDASGIAGKEFSLRHARTCHCVAWNPKDPRYLAICLEKNRGERDRDCCLLVWDVTTAANSDLAVEVSEHKQRSIQSHFQPPSRPDNFLQLFDSGYPPQHAVSQTSLTNGRAGAGSGSSLNLGQKAAYEGCPGETVFSCDWLQHGKALACGTQQKCIRIFDLRSDQMRPQLCISTRAVQGLKVDPHDEDRVAAFSDNQICLWDLRVPDKPLLTVTETKPIVKLHWDPVKVGVFSALCKESQAVKVYQLLRCTGDDTDFSYIEKAVSVPFSSTSAVIASYDWHPVIENRLLVVSTTGQLAETIVCYRLPLSWAQSGNLVTAFGRAIFECRDFYLPRNTGYVQDISEIMKQRAKAGYGSNDQELDENGNLMGEFPDQKLEWIWQWVQDVKQLMKEKDRQAHWKFDLRIPGINTVLKDLSSVEKKDTYSQGQVYKAFHSAERERALEICGWGLVHRSSVTKSRISAFIRRLESMGQPERAAALMTFTYRLHDAVEILARAASAKPGAAYLNLVAMAVAGYSSASANEKDHVVHPSRTPFVFQDICKNMLPTLNHPYLRAIFKFLQCKLQADPDYKPIISDKSLALVDRVACAILFIDNEQLGQLISEMTSAAVTQGDLNGLLFTGLGSPQSMDLLQRYVDRTGDVQTASLLLLHSGCLPNPCLGSNTDDTGQNSVPFPAIYGPAFYSNPAVRIFDAYRSLLNEWELYYCRAKLDCLLLSSFSQVISQTGAACGRESPLEQMVDLVTNLTTSFSTQSLLNNNSSCVVVGGTGGSSPDIPNSPSQPNPTNIAAAPISENNSAVNSPMASQGLLFAPNSEPSAAVMVPSAVSSASLQQLVRAEGQKSYGPVQSQIFLSCTFCGKSIWLGRGSRSRGVQAMSCPQCKRPLPRCSVCLQRLGSMTESIAEATVDGAKFSSWFSWCQTCRHGGHSVHMLQWFKVHTECPVASCSCKCHELDAFASAK